MGRRRFSAIYLGWKGSETSRAVEAIVCERFAVLRALEVAFREVVDQAELAALRPDFLFSFGPLIVHAPLLAAVQKAAVNFHTAPPRWPGRGSCSFALFHGDVEFGVTAHLMTRAVDAGPILRVVRFPITPKDSADRLHARALEHIPELARLTIDDLLRAGGEPRPTGEQWERGALRQRDLEVLMRIEPNEPPELVQRKIRALAHPTKPGPYVDLHGHRFWYLGEPTG